MLRIVLMTILAMIAVAVVAYVIFKTGQLSALKRKADEEMQTIDDRWTPPDM